MDVLGGSLSASPALELTTLGFWLPCGRTNFIRHHADHKLCGEAFELAEILRQDLAWRTEQFQREDETAIDDADVDEKVSPDTEILQSSIYRRLITVLAYNGYERGYGITPEYVDTLNDEDHDPSAVLLFGRQFDQVDWPTSADVIWPDSIAKGERDVHYGTKEAVKFIALLVNARGFYAWMVAHTPLQDNVQRTAMQLALRKHMMRLAGGDFYLHLAKPQVGSDKPPAQSLEVYRDEHKGFLPFFQLNTILEGLYSYTFDPRIFFQSQQTNQDKIKAGYSIGKFIKHIIATTELGSDKQLTQLQADAAPETTGGALSPWPDTLPPTIKRPQSDREAPPSQKPVDPGPTQAEIVAWLSALSGFAPSPYADKDKIKIARKVRKHCLNNQVRRDLLRQFLRKVTVITLQRMKWRIERTRRALLTEVIEITHRQEPLEQIEAPEQSDYIEEVNEAQLRGYVMLFAAKFPLIRNVDRYLQDACQSIEIEGDTPEEKKRQLKLYRDPLSVFLHNWDALLYGIEDNIKGLERAVEQARMDRLVYEEQQIRSVQETLGEIDRIRERADSSLSPTSGLAVNILASLLAAAAVALSFFGVVKQFSITLPELTLPFLVLLIVGSSISIIIALLVVNAILQKFIDSLIQVYFFVRRGMTKQGKRHNERLYYEMDIHLDIPLDPPNRMNPGQSGVYNSIASEIPAQIFEANFTPKTKFMRLAKDVRENWLLGFKPFIIAHSALERKSYRVERVSENESAHKIYIETAVRWWRRWSPLRIFFPDMEIFLVYEVLFHRPGGQLSYALQDVRVISTYDWNLHANDISALKTLVIERFINTVLPKPLKESDALITVSPRLFYDSNKNLIWQPAKETIKDKGARKSSKGKRTGKQR